MRIDASKLSLFGVDLSRALSWWQEGMRQILPPGWTGFFLKTLPCLVIDVAGDSLRVLRKNAAGDIEELTSLTLEDLDTAADGSLRSMLESELKGGVTQTEIVLCLPDERVLLRSLKVPLAARSNLRTMVGYQLPRLTPFSSDAVYFDVRIEAIDEATQSLEVEVLIVLRSVVDPLIANLARTFGARVGCVTIRQGSMEELSPFNLMPAAAGGVRWWQRLSPNAYLAALLVVVMAAAIITPVYKQRSLVVERKLQLLELNARAADLLGKKQTLDSELALIEYMANRRQKSWSPVAVLAELTRVIPPSAYVSSLSLRDGEVEIGGAGSGVVDLIEQINSSPLFVGARFTAPLSRDSRTGKDQFRIVFRLLQGEGEQ